MNRKTLLVLSMMISFFAVAGEMSAYIPTPNCYPTVCPDLR